MRRLFSISGKKLLIVLLLLATVGAVLWWQRAPLLTWYYLRGLARADDSDRAQWVQRVASLDSDAVPGLMDHFKRNDAKVCANAEAALAALVKRWGVNHARTAALAEEVSGAFSVLSTPGREAVLEWYLAILQQIEPTKPASRPLIATAGKLLQIAAHVPEKGVHLRTLALAEVMLARLHPDKAELYRELALRGIAAKDNDIRVRAVRLAMHAPLHADTELVDNVVPLLKDAAAEVRRAALLAVGLSEKHLTVDDLLPLLQDADAEVRRLCETALRGRGLQDSHIKRAKLISDPRPEARLLVVNDLHEAEDLDPGVWLQRLSQDPEKAVRAAAIRFAAENPASADFRERLEQMAQGDPNPSVQEIARLWLKILARN
jgi:hypothetical protein